MNVIQKNIEAVRRHIRDAYNGSPQKLATMSGLHRNTLNGWEAKDWNPTAETLSAVNNRIAAERKRENILPLKSRRKKS